MKRVLSISLFLLGALSMTGCLKDRGYEENKYGILITDLPAVSFPQSSSSPVSLSLSSSSTSQTITTDLVIEGSDPAASDITVNLVTDTVGFAAAGLTAFPTSTYNLSATQTIRAGSRLSVVTITFPNTTSLNPILKYGLAMTISSVSSGYQIPANLKRIVFGFSIKNAYDGIYSVVSGYVQRYTAPGSPENPSSLSGNLAGNPDVYLVTTGPASLGIPASGNTGTLYWANGTGSQVAGIDNVRLAVDPTTNQVTMSSLGNATLANWETKENRYDPATRTFYLNFRWNPTANRREYSVVLKYSKAR